jgi:putative nucleotidyltransferase with HDIG domain
MFPESSFTALRASVVSRLKKVDKHYSYHNLDHVLDVIKQVERIATEEGVDEGDILLLRVAALYHDIGYPEGRQGHEQRGCEIFEQDALKWKFSLNEIHQVKRLILATQVPQSPITKLEEIICDADLDYLGRNDFQQVGNRLRDEYVHFKVLQNRHEWDDMQIRFLEKHRYFTTSSRKLREPLKQQHLSKLKQQ